MIVLGLSTGHDASVALLADGQVVAYVLRERITRIKHDVGVSKKMIKQALEDAGLRESAIDAIAWAAREGEACFADDPDYFHLECDDLFRDCSAFSPMSIADMGEQTARAARATPPVMARPVKAWLFGRNIPAIAVYEPAAHAASGFFVSGIKKAQVLIYDSGKGAGAGWLFYGSDSSLRPVLPHYLAVSGFYKHMAALCGLGGVAGSGKMMGLSSFGEARLGLEIVPGTMKDWAEAANLSPLDEEGVFESLSKRMVDVLGRSGGDLSLLGRADRLPNGTVADLAASAQRLFTETVLSGARAMAAGLRFAGCEVDGLCLSGGGALNCPTNTRLATDGAWERVFVEPHCDNGGLSIGAARWVWHVEGNRSPVVRADKSSYAMMGPRYHPQSFDAYFSTFAGRMTATQVSNPCRSAASDLADNKTIGWFVGRSEAGPRALGHRSIFAHPGYADNHGRINRIKGREQWRPFAPICLVDAVHGWFDGPQDSPFMLMTCDVKESVRDRVPAIVHADGTARLQTVSRGDGELHELLSDFQTMTGLPMVLNTSLNGPNEPLVETPGDALALFANSQLDVLYIDGRRITRR